MIFVPPTTLMVDSEWFDLMRDFSEGALRYAVETRRTRVHLDAVQGVNSAVIAAILLGLEMLEVNRYTLPHDPAG